MGDGHGHGIRIGNCQDRIVWSLKSMYIKKEKFPLVDGVSKGWLYKEYYTYSCPTR